jgi:hypothetical protein
MQHPTRRRRRRSQPVDAPAHVASRVGRGSGRRAIALLAVLVCGVVGLSACSGTGDERAVATTTLPDTVPPELAVGANVTVPVTLPVPDNFIAPDTRGAQIPPVLSKVKDIDHSKPILPIEGGTARISGVVLGPDGPVEGAVVRLERFVGPDFGQLDVRTNKDGRYDARDILGGRYRLRAFQKPSLATIEPPALFLAADHGEATLDLVTEKFEGESLQGALDVADPHVGQKVTFRALYSKLEVNDDGIVVGTGLEGHEVQLTPVDSGIKVDGENGDVKMTGPDGMALFTVICEGEGVHSVIIGSGDKALAVGLPNCLPGGLSFEDIFGTTTTTAAPPPTTPPPPTTRPAPTTTPPTRPPTTPTTRPTTTTTTTKKATP